MKHSSSIITTCLVLVLAVLSMTSPCVLAQDTDDPLDPKALAAEITRLEENLAQERRELDKLHERFHHLRVEEAEKLGNLGMKNEELTRFENIFREAAAESLDLFESSLVAPRHPALIDAFRTRQKEDVFPSLKDIESLVELLFQEMEANGRIENFQGRFIDRRGLESEGEILRAGGISAYYRNNQETGFLRPLVGARSYMAVPTEPDRGQVEEIVNFMNDKGESLPLDLSSGAVFTHMNSGLTWRERLAAGGVLVWPILFLAVVAALLIVERIIVLGRLKSNSDSIFNRVKELAASMNWSACVDLCLDARTPSCQVILAGLRQKDRSAEVIENAVQEAILGQMPKLERFLPTLNVLAAIAPLLGLLGTVTGMIETFRVITVFGSGDPRLMAGGISEALITTQLGLAVAMPIILIHHFLERRVDAIVDDMEEKGLALFSAIGGR